MVIYIDIFLLENIIMNYIILIAVSIVVKRKIRFLRFFISSFFGSVCSLCNYFFTFSIITNFLYKVLISIIMIKIAFKNFRKKSFLKQLLIFYFISFSFGGCSFMLLFNLTSLKNFNILKITLIGGVGGLLLLSIIICFYKNKFDNQICDIEIIYNNKNKKIKAFMDSGNLLKEPISMNDVIIVEKDSLNEIVDSSVLDNINSYINGKLTFNESIFVNNGIKIIPFSSLGNKNGLLVGFKPDYIRIYNNEIKIIKNVFIGIYDGKLTKSNLYTSLIGLNIIKECDLND